MANLFLLATPIGNIQDVSEHFKDTLDQIDILFCEDTRVTGKLLSLIGIKKKIQLKAVHKFNETKMLDECISLIKQHQCGYVSDAGYPTISDPGYLLVNACYQHDIRVDVIDGPSALTHALAQCGFDTRRFLFLGFLSRTEKDIQAEITSAFKSECPIVIFEAVHRINQTLDYLKKMQLDRRIYIGRELTKKFETITRDTLANIPPQIEKGEFVIIIDNYPTIVADNWESLVKDYQALIQYGMKPKDACKYLANKHPQYKANDLYQKFLKRD